MLGYTFQSGRHVKGAIPAPVLTATDFRAATRRRPSPITGYTGNLPEFQKNAASGGHFNPTVDDDGITRRVPMLARVRRRRITSRSRSRWCGSSRVLRRSSRSIGGRRHFEPATSGSKAFASAKYQIPVDDDRRRARAVSRAAADSFAYHSLVDVLNDRVAGRAAQGQDRARRHQRAGSARPAGDAGRPGVSRGRDPRQPDRRHARREHQAQARRTRTGAEFAADPVPGPRAGDLAAACSPPQQATAGHAERAAARRRHQSRAFSSTRTSCCRSPRCW